MHEPADAVGQLGEVFSLKGEHQTVAASFWAWLGQQDHHIRPPAPDTIGSIWGNRLHVEWWTDPTGAWFAAQVVDLTLRGLWEVFLVPSRSGQGEINALQERYRALEFENKTLRKLFTQPALTPSQEASQGSVQQAPARPLEERMGVLLGL